MRSQLAIEEKFSEFYERWMKQLEDHLKLLLKIAQENNSKKEACVITINKLTAHHKKFYKIKWAHEDVLDFFAPLWLTSLKNAYMWVTGWKPSMIFWFVESLKKSSLFGMTEEQIRKIEEEEKVGRELERQHVRIADQNIVELVQLESKAKRNGDSENRVNDLVEAALEELLAA